MAPADRDRRGCAGSSRAVCVIVPLLVGYARLYRGMHHLVDILVGMVNGIVCALLAWNYLRRRTSGDRVTGAVREAVSR